jgi:hypothetical protein
LSAPPALPHLADASANASANANLKPQLTMPGILFDRPWKRLLWFALIPAIIYLPSALRLTYYRDDWYYAYDALVGPAGVFRLMFASDRPARGPFFDLYQALFGITPLPYHLAMFAWRLGGGLATAWLFQLVWPRARRAGWVAGLLFALYPGFTWWVSGIEYQPMVASAALMVLSLALTVQSLRLVQSWRRTLCTLGAIATGWTYLALVEYAAGIELLRLCLVFVVTDEKRAATFRHRASLALRSWLVYLVIPAGFAVWRFLLFTSQRKATDLGAQLGALQSDPLSTALHWLVNSIVSFLNVSLSAWVVPLMSNFFSGSLREILIALLVALAAAAASWLFLTATVAHSEMAQDSPAARWPIQSVWVGLVGVILGIAPIIVANREITFPNFSHYALPASLGLAFAVTGGLFTIAVPRLRATMFSGLVLLSALTHWGLGSSALREQRTLSNFWQQMSWRAPSISAGTTLLVYYPGISYADDTDIVWGPANYVYFPGGQTQLPVKVPISALPTDAAAINNLLLGHEPQESTYRAHTSTVDYARTVVIAQSAEDACIRVIDPRWPTFSLTDDPVLRLIAPASRVENIQASGLAVASPVALFGPESQHGWCFYFEQASLASQHGDWEQVAAVQAQVDNLSLHPNDQVEWMPFLQAQAYLGNPQEVKQIASRINTQKLYKDQACRNLSAMSDQGYPLPTETQALVDALFCGAKP